MRGREVVPALSASWHYFAQAAQVALGENATDAAEF